MKYWIVPCRESVFNIDTALKANQDEKDHTTFVDWRQSNDFAIGDVVFLYKASPKSQVAYKMEVIATSLSKEESTDDIAFWKDDSIFYEGLYSHKYVRFRLMMEYPEGLLTYKAMREHGLRSNIQSVMLCKSEELLAFLKGDATLFPFEGGQEGASVAEYTEGEVHEVVLNRYERNREAREACIAAKGCRCAVCGFDFEQTYGEIGKGFIHVHHLVPISSIGKAYQLNPTTDLVPVCPNCHNMLHRKEPPYTIEELQQYMRERSKVWQKRKSKSLNNHNASEK